MDSLKEIAIYFRYYDENNHYVLKFNVPGQKKTELYKRVSGFETLMGINIISDSNDESFKTMVWYRFFVVFHND